MLYGFLTSRRRLNIMLYRGRYFLKSTNSLRKVTSTRHCNSASESNLGVVIPKRIERGPTDILKALASTVEQDPTAFPYKYPDDPYFYPFSNYEKRLYALSMESGRKSARWIVENNPEFFTNKLSQPPIKAFQRKIVYDKNSIIQVQTLVDVIEQRKVLDAITVFNLLQEKGIDISNDLKQSLLELVCFYNAEDTPNLENLEYKWFENPDEINIDVNTWKEQSFAEMLFESMDPKCPLANSTIIQGMLKYNNVNRAFEIYNTAKSNNVKFSVGVYNALLTQASNTNADIGQGVTFITETLKTMASENVKPNLGTLNAAIKSLANLNFPRKENFMKKLLMEFAFLKVEPSLGTYYYIFYIIARSKMNYEDKKYIYMTLLNLIEGTNYDVMHPSDFLFFPGTMKLFSKFTKGTELPSYLHDILIRKDNKKFIQNSVSESFYFQDYLSILFKREPLEIAMEKYSEIVPAMYCPDLKIIPVILTTVIENQHNESLVRLWDDIKRFKLSKIRIVLSKIIEYAKISTNENVVEVIKEAAENLFESLKESKLESVSQDLLSNLLIAFLKIGDHKRALELFNKVNDSNSANEFFNENAIMELMQYALDNNKFPIVKECLNYAVNEIYSEVIKAAEIALPSMPEKDQEWVTEMLNKFQKTNSIENEIE